MFVTGIPGSCRDGESKGLRLRGLGNNSKFEECCMQFWGVEQGCWGMKSLKRWKIRDGGSKSF